MGVNSYSEQIDIDNTYRLRMLISTLPPYAKIIFVVSSLIQNRAPELLMHTI